MHTSSKIGLSMFVALLLATTAMAQNRDEHDRGGAPHAMARPAAPAGEAHPGPRGYSRVTEPHGWNARPAAVDRGAYQHNFHAARAFHIGPYHRPEGWRVEHWHYGEILPPAYWTSEYLLADYWLFGLEVPPAGFEWVRDDDDALLININNGEILQVEYGAFG